jgi:hypothetical protein
MSDTSAFEDQLNAAAVDAINQARIQDEMRQLAQQDRALDAALQAMKKVWNFIGSPENILGDLKTKHGEIAENVEVGVRNAYDLVNGVEPTAVIDGIDRTGPVDYQLGDIDVQSKFINGPGGKSLYHVLQHMKMYPNFAQNGDSSIYHIPKDQYETVLKIINGEPVEGLNASSIKAILAKVAEIEQLSGQDFKDVVQPSTSTYAEVQQGKIVETLDKHEDGLKEQNEKHKEQIRIDHEPSLMEGLKATGIAAAVGAAVGFTTEVIRKYRKEDKNIFKGDFTAEDWKEVGLSTLKSGAIGGASGAAIYALTNCAGLSAPFAGAFVAAVKGLAPLVSDYRQGKIPFDALLDGGMFVCTDVALVGVCTAAGQALIPVPILGAVIGSIAGKVLSSLLTGKVKGVQAAIEARMKAAMDKLEAAYQAVVTRVTAEFERLGDLTVAAFDLERNALLVERSLTLAREYGVAEHLLMKTDEDLDAFMLN